MDMGCSQRLWYFKGELKVTSQIVDLKQLSRYDLHFSYN